MKGIKAGFAAAGVICIILLIIIPLPSWMLDVLLILNLSLAITVLLIAMSIQRTLEFSILPSLLLLATLFRLGLEISATRLILTNDGNAGEVIKAFGNFVIEGNIGVGLIIFLIIVVVQFIVITKGAERVAEVSARFTLDAMPGKQMAIDADLNSGLITEDAAKTRRRDIQREADFFGAMDGASKFVKGDAIVAIVIMVINIVGGIIMGLLGGSDISSVISTYTLATVGEGLMAQLPALLISTSTGIVVTRTASDSNMSAALPQQLFANPLVLRMTGILLLCMMLIPGFPWMVLLLLGAAFLIAGSRAAGAKKKEAPPAAAPQNNMKSELETLRNPESIYRMIEVEPLEMDFGFSLIPLVDESQGGSFVDKVVLFRRQFAMETGVVIPSVRMRDNVQLENNQYVIRLRGEQVAEGRLLPGHFLMMGQGDRGSAIAGIDTLEPAFGLPAKWITKEQRGAAELAGCTVIDPASVMMTHLGEVIRTHAAELVGRNEINAMLDMVRRGNKALVEETVPGKISVGDLQHVVQNLLAEKIPVRDMVTVLETVAEQAARVKDPDILTEYVRQGLRRTISRKFAPKGEIRALIVDPQTEKLISGGVRQNEHGITIVLEPDRAQAILKKTEEEIGRMSESGTEPVLIVSPGIRLYLRKFLERTLPDLTILSYNELENSVRVQAVGAIAA